jgi:hypothetical protein
MLEWYKEWVELEEKDEQRSITFSHSVVQYNYYEMAVATAKRINHFLVFIVTLITDADFCRLKNRVLILCLSRI